MGKKRKKKLEGIDKNLLGRRRGEDQSERNVRLTQNLYQRNKMNQLGDELTCPMCHDNFIKIQHQQAFCRGVCKDYYWNYFGGQKRRDRIKQYANKKRS